MTRRTLLSVLGCLPFAGWLREKTSTWTRTPEAPLDWQRGESTYIGSKDKMYQVVVYDQNGLSGQMYTVEGDLIEDCVPVSILVDGRTIRYNARGELEAER